MLHIVALTFFSTAFLGSVAVIAFMFRTYADQIADALAYRPEGDGDDAYAAIYRVELEWPARTSVISATTFATAARGIKPIAPLAIAA